MIKYFYKKFSKSLTLNSLILNSLTLTAASLLIFSSPIYADDSNNSLLEPASSLLNLAVGKGPVAKKANVKGLNMGVLTNNYVESYRKYGSNYWSWDNYQYGISGKTNDNNNYAAKVCNEVGSLVGVTCYGTDYDYYTDFDQKAHVYFLKEQYRGSGGCQTQTLNTNVKTGPLAYSVRDLRVYITYSLDTPYGAVSIYEQNCDLGHRNGGAELSKLKNIFINSMVQSDDFGGSSLVKSNCDNVNNCNLNDGFKQLIRKYTQIKLSTDLPESPNRKYSLDLFFTNSQRQLIKIPGCKQFTSPVNTFVFDGICDQNQFDDSRAQSGYVENRDKFSNYSLDLCYTDNAGQSWTCASNGDTNHLVPVLNAFEPKNVDFNFSGKPADVSQDVWNRISSLPWTVINETFSITQIYLLKNTKPQETILKIDDYIHGISENEGPYTVLKNVSQLFNLNKINVLIQKPGKTETFQFVPITRCVSTTTGIHSTVAGNESCASLQMQNEATGYILPVGYCNDANSLSLYAVQNNPAIRLLYYDDAASVQIMKAIGFRLERAKVGCTGGQ